MPYKLNTLVNKIELIPNLNNSQIVTEFLQYMTDRDFSLNHKINNLKVVISFAGHLGMNSTFFDINKKEQILEFLDTKKKDLEHDGDRKWITTWNYYLNRIKLFYRWLYNTNKDQTVEIAQEDLKTPEFVRIRTKKTKRLSPYSESELWEREDILLITKYEKHRRNKAVITLLWDLDARPHEITLLKIKHITIREQYGEGEIPHQAKTGSGPILLTCSLPYLRDWLNEHPFRNEPDARLICNLITGAPIGPEAIWTLMKELKDRICRLLDEGDIINKNEREKLNHLIKTKKWNPYCIRHSAITSDSDFLPEYALKKKVRWSMNSKQAARYIKTRMGNDLKQKILSHNGIILQEELKIKPSSVICPRCSLVNTIENKYCSKCFYPLNQSVFEEIKQMENMKINEMIEKFDKEIKNLNARFAQNISEILSVIQKDPRLTQIKITVLKKKLRFVNFDRN
jgi:hypothetical protein